MCTGGYNRMKIAHQLCAHMGEVTHSVYTMYLLQYSDMIHVYMGVVTVYIPAAVQ